MKKKCCILLTVLMLAVPFNSYSTEEAMSFQVYILKENADQLKLGYTYDNAWEVLNKVDLRDSDFVITAEDIESYNWSKQSIVLGLKASIRLRQKFANDGYLPIVLGHRGFVITLNGKRLYGGIFLEYMSAIQVNYPVIYLDISQDKIILSVRPFHTIFDNYQNMSSSLKAIIEIQKIHDFFLTLGKLID